MTTYKQIFENNRRWMKEKTKNSPDYFTKLAKDQNPNFLYIGCSDSRVSASDIMGVDAGEVFVHRNIANLVISIDMNAMTVINYAVEHLGVKEIIVCGHYNCGGVKAAMQAKDLAGLNGWLRNIRDVFRLHKDELMKIKDEEKRYKRLVELNVYEQCRNVIKTAAVQKSFVENGYPIVHGWVFDLHTGLIKDLKIDFERVLRDIQEIYNLTDKPLIESIRQKG
ncbi:MAG: carbonic anhydrase [Pyrinomonadaceae bacterium]